MPNQDVTKVIDTPPLAEGVSIVPPSWPGEEDSKISYAGTEAALIASGLLRAEWLEGLPLLRTRQIVLRPDGGFAVLSEGKGNRITWQYRDGGAFSLKRQIDGRLVVSKYRPVKEWRDRKAQRKIEFDRGVKNTFGEKQQDESKLERARATALEQQAADRYRGYSGEEAHAAHTASLDCYLARLAEWIRGSGYPFTDASMVRIQQCNLALRDAYVNGSLAKHTGARRQQGNVIAFADRRSRAS